MSDERLLGYLTDFVKEERLEVFQKTLNFRTRYLTVCLEDIYQPHNASAVLRTCDAFGIQDVHIVEKNNRYKVNPLVAGGSYKWVNIHKYNRSANPTMDAISALRNKGYRIVATTPHNSDISLPDFDLQKGPAALIFGTELTGVSDEVKQHADEFLRIPMYGFVESFNISVSAAVILHHLTLKLRLSDIGWSLSEDEKKELLLEWLKTSIRESEKIIQRYYELT